VEMEKLKTLLRPNTGSRRTRVSIGVDGSIVSFPAVPQPNTKSKMVKEGSPHAPASHYRELPVPDCWRVFEKMIETGERAHHLNYEGRLFASWFRGIIGTNARPTHV